MKSKKLRILLIAAAVLAAALIFLLPRRADHSAERPDTQTASAMSADELAVYQVLFDTPSWYAQAVFTPFADRAAVDLNTMFYDGLSYDLDGHPVYGGFVTAEDGDEWTWVQENVPGATETDVSRMSRSGMYEVLWDTLYGDIDISDDLYPAGWTYWEETDCWYHAHGDTGINSVTLLSGQWTGEGAGYFLTEGPIGETYQISFTLGQTEADAGHLYLLSCTVQ